MKDSRKNYPILCLIEPASKRGKLEENNLFPQGKVLQSMFEENNLFPQAKVLQSKFEENNLFPQAKEFIQHIHTT